MQHVAPGKTVRCALCGSEESTAGTFPIVIGVGRICLKCGMEKVRCDVCGDEVKRLTSSRFQGKTLCLKDHMKEIEKYKQHIVKSFDQEEVEGGVATGAGDLGVVFQRVMAEGPEGYTLLAFRRARNSTHVWEAEYEKSEVFEMRCS